MTNCFDVEVSLLPLANHCGTSTTYLRKTTDCTTMTESPMTPLSPSPSELSLLCEDYNTASLIEDPTTVPECYEIRIPPERISVSALLNDYDLPVRILPSSLREYPLTAYSTEPPTFGPYSFVDLALPYTGERCTFVFTLSSNIQGEISNGKSSVHVGELYLPLWVVSFWTRVASATKGHLDWTRAKLWSEEYILSRPELDPFAYLHQYIPQLWLKLPWTGKIMIGGHSLHIYELMQLFTFESITDNLIDAVNHCIQLRVLKSRGRIRRTLVSNLAIYRALSQPKKLWKHYQSENQFKAIRAIDSRIKDEGIVVLFFPFFVRGNHWVVFEVDFEQKSISYGDSCGLQVDRDDLAAVRLWLKQLGYVKFTCKTLRTALQDDAHSCGVIVWNTIETRIFSEAVWKSETKHVHRVSYAVKLLEASDEGFFTPIEVSHSFNY